MVQFSVLIAITSALFSCAEMFSERRQRPAKPSEEIEPLPGYLDEASRTVEPNEEAVISLGEATLKIPSGSFHTSVFIKMTRAEVAEVGKDEEERIVLGDPKSSIVDISVFESADNMVILPPEELHQALSVSLLSRDTNEASNLKAVIVTNSETNEQKHSVTSARDLDIEATSGALELVARNYRVGMSLRATHARIWLIESEFDFGESATNSGGNGSSSTDTTSTGTGTTAGTGGSGGTSNAGGSTGGGSENLFLKLPNICLRHAGSASYSFEGTGTADDPYIICNKDQIFSIADNCKTGSTAACNKNFLVMSDIDMTGVTMTPIGNGVAFTAVFDGNHHTISNLSINLPTTDYVGLIGRMAGGVIQNLTLHNASITGGRWVGAFVGATTDANGSKLFNLQVTGGSTIQGYNDVGGIIGAANYAANSMTVVSRVFSSATVQWDGTNSSVVIGGIAGVLDWTKLQFCASTGQVTAGNSPTPKVGGITGAFATNSEIMDCYSTSPIVAHSSAIDVGGIAGMGRDGSILRRTLSAVSFSVAGHDAILGTDVNGQLTLANNYFDSSVSGSSAWPGTTGLSTANARLRASFTGLSFQKYWTIHEGSGYPKLVYEPTGCGEVLAHESSGLDRFDDIGDGTAAAPYQICSAAQLNSIGSSGCGASTTAACNSHFLLGSDIDMSDLSLSTHNRIASSTNAFSGVFDGRGHSVRNFKINANGENRIGFISYLAPSSNLRPITNLGLIDIDIAAAGDEVGGLIGAVGGSSGAAIIHNCFVTGSVLSNGSGVGGLIGRSGDNSAAVVIRKAFADVDITINNSASQSNVGGIIGEASPTSLIGDAYSEAHIAITGSGDLSNIGGVVGRSGSASFRRLYASGSITISSANLVSHVGGVLGETNGGANTFDNILTAINIAATGQTTHVGGFRGGFPTGGTTETIGKVLSLVSISGSPASSGGFTGDAQGTYDSFSQSYWDSTRFSLTSADSSNISDVSGVEGRSSPDLQSQSTYVGWDFTTTWKISAGQYPKLIWQQ